MKVSLHWLKKYIDIDASPVEIADMLTAIGLEVESMEHISSIKGGLEGIVIGEVVSCEKHPDADKLSLTQVNVGSENLLQIVCGAPNVAKGQKVLVATIGSTIYPKNGDPLTMKKVKIRGVESNGMICAADELGLGQDHSGILIMPDDCTPGTKATEHFEVLNDVIFEIGLTPNRSDATCHLGVARDLYAYAKVNKDNSTVFTEPNNSGFHIESQSQEIKVNLKRPDLCPRYSGLIITGVTVTESPLWLKNQLTVLGIKSINNIVDITNFVLHELGQPLHAFDADAISDRTIYVDTLPKGYKFHALDKRIFELNGEEVVICNGAMEGMCIGGVFGGIDSGVKESTKNIFLESAHFHPKSIRKTSMYHNLRTDAAKVFEKGSDPNICVFALKRAAGLIMKIAGGAISSEIVDIYPKEIKPREIHVKYENINHTIGTTISEEHVHNILNALGMEINAVDEFSFKTFVPTNKADVLREIDVIEEILRIYGFNNVPLPNKISSAVSYAPNPNKFQILNQLCNHLSSSGFNEMMGLSLMDSKLCLDLNYAETDLVYINNTSNAGLDIMRPSLLLSGLNAVSHNLNRQQTNLKLYEVGKSYSKAKEDFREEEELTLFVTGNEADENWDSVKPLANNYFSIKRECDKILAILNCETEALPIDHHPIFQYGIKYQTRYGLIVELGEIQPLILKKFGIKQKVFAAKFSIVEIIKSYANRINYVKELSRFPAVRRDLAIVIDKAIDFKSIYSAILDKNKQNLKEVKLFDIYENENILGKGKKSYALSFTFENFDKTLTDREIDSEFQEIIKICETDLKAVVRK